MSFKHVFVVETEYPISEGIRRSDQRSMINALERFGSRLGGGRNAFVSSHVNQPADKPVVVYNGLPDHKAGTCG